MRSFIFWMVVILCAHPVAAQGISVDSLVEIDVESGKSASIADGKVTIASQGGFESTLLTFEGVVGVADDFSNDIHQYTERSIKVMKNQSFYIAIDSGTICRAVVVRQHRGDLTLRMQRLSAQGVPSDFLGSDRSTEGVSGWIGALVSVSAVSLSNHSVTGSLTGVTFAPTFCFLVSPDAGWGLDFSATRMSNGSFTQSQLGINLKGIIAFGSVQSRPYLSLGMGGVIALDSYLWPGSSESATRTGIMARASLGFLSRIGDKTAVPFEFGFVYSTLESERATMLTFGVGLVGILK